ncbi:MAG: ATP-dependent DNA helicase RecG [Candidatus Saccharimonadales bacterium]
MNLSDPITSLKGVGEAAGKKFASLGISTLEDLALNVPRKYEDYSVVTPINRLRPGAVSVLAHIKSASGRYVRRGMHVTEAIASDDTGGVRLVWFNQPYREAALKRDADYYISGEYEFKSSRLAIMNPSMELVSDMPVNVARVVPVYRETKGFTSRQIRAAAVQIRGLLAGLPETLPPNIVTSQKLLSRGQALTKLHFPESIEDIKQARARFGFEEIFGLSLAGLMNKQENAGDASVHIPFKQDLAKSFVSHLPFTLTPEQKQVIWRIYQDMELGTPMDRLVEGDVGSGKTVVATMAAIMAIEQGFQVALMAPTEILARQHADTVYKLLEPLGLSQHVRLLIGSLSLKQKKRTQEDIAAGRVRFIIGTHALIQDKVGMHNLGLVIVDEQHRFGVEQRKTLQKKAGKMPHILHLTATPIPRSLALTLYGELDVSIIKAKPAGRQPIETEICSPNSRPTLYAKIEKELATGRQMFVVCPLIRDSDTLPARSAEEAFADISKNFKNRRVVLLHGKMKGQEKADIMQDFLEHKTDILVSTTVIEVGVDVPNASIMLIESAERFGLAQIHQLRGRVGRGGHRGYCYLMLSDSRPASRRLRALESSNNGFELAELDLQLRGPGALYGLAQHGALDLRVANLTDIPLISRAREAAESFMKSGQNLVKYKELHERVKTLRTITNVN